MLRIAGQRLLFIAKNFQRLLARRRAHGVLAATPRCALYVVRIKHPMRSPGFVAFFNLWGVLRFSYQLASRSGEELILWMARSAPSYSSSWLIRKPVVIFNTP